MADINALIAQGVPVPQLPGPLDLDTAVQKNALLRQQAMGQGVENQLNQQKIQQQNAIMQSLQRPGAFDQKTGRLTPEGIGYVSQTNPELGAKIGHYYTQADQEIERAKVNKAESAIKNWELDEKAIAFMLAESQNIQSKYERLLPTLGKDGAMRVINEQDMPESSARLKSSGYVRPEVYQQFGTTYDPDNSPAAMTAMQNRLQAMRAVKEQPEIYIGEGNTFRRGTMGTPWDVWYPPDKKWVPHEGTMPALTKVGATPPLTIEQVGARAEASAAGRARGTPVGPYGGSFAEMPAPQQATVDFYADMQLGGDNTWRVGLGRIKSGAELIKAVDERVPARAAELGIGPADVGTAKGIRVATQSAMNANAKDIATLKPYAAMLDQNAEILKGLARKVILTDSALANRPLNWLRSNAADSPNVAEYLAQMEIVKNEATRVISNPRLVGQMTDTARQEIEAIINGTMPLQATERVLERIKNDSERRVATMETQQKELEAKLKKSYPTGAKEKEAAPTTSATTGTKANPIKLTNEADFANVPSGGYFIAPSETKIRGPKP